MSVKLPPPLPVNPEESLEMRAHQVYQIDFGVTSLQILLKNAIVYVNHRPHPANLSREHTYWHLVTEGKPEEMRCVPVEERLVKIPWVRPVLKSSEHPAIKIWLSPRQANSHYCVWYVKVNYLVVVKQTTRGWLLKTAYTPSHIRITKLHQEYAYAKRYG